MGLTSLLRIAVPALAGAFAGLSAAVFAGALGRGVPRAEPPALAPVVQDRAVPSAEGNDVRLDSRIALLEKRVQALAVSAADAGGPAAPAPKPEEDREMRTQRFLEEHARFLAQHDAERRDGAWASNEERSVQATLGDLSETMKRAFSLESVDCRTSTCVAALTWPSETAARAGLHDLLVGSAAAGCAREIAYPSATGEGPYRASLVLDCAEARWGAPQGSR
jgi:hypothetical protein